MSDPSRFAIRSSHIVTPDGVLDGYVVVDAGMIAEVLPADSRADRVPGIPVEDVGSLAVMPGLVDTHVHVNEPGRTDWEGFETATKAAAAAGITTIIDMPLNSAPVTTNAAALEAKVQAATGKLHVDCGFYGGVVPGCIPDLPDLLKAGVLGMKVFMIDSGLDDFPATGREELTKAAEIIAEAGIPLLAHAEREPSSPGVAGPKAPSFQQTRESREKVSDVWTPAFAGVTGPVTNYPDYVATRPPEWELHAIRELIEITETTGCRIHVVHLSTATALPTITDARRRGVPITVETCPHYLYFDADSIPAGSTLHKCTPPIRDLENGRRLWEGLVRGEIDLVASDHSPCPPPMKLDVGLDLGRAWGGIASLELGPSVILTLVSDRGGSLTDCARWMSMNPARLIGLDHRKGSIEVGKDADLAIWDLKKRFVVEPASLYQRHKLTAYAGCTLTGRVQKTYVRGQAAFCQGSLATPAGDILLRP